MIVQGGDLVVAKLGKDNTAGIVMKAAKLPDEAVPQAVFSVKFAAVPDKVFTWVISKDVKDIHGNAYTRLEYMPNDYNFQPYLSAITRKKEVIWKEG